MEDERDYVEDNERHCVLQIVELSAYTMIYVYGVHNACYY